MMPCWIACFLQTLEAEADRETEALAEASKAKRKDGKSQPPVAVQPKSAVKQQPVLHLGGTSMPYRAAIVGNGVAAAGNIPLEQATASPPVGLAAATPAVVPGMGNAAEPVSAAAALAPRSCAADAAAGVAASAAAGSDADAEMDAAMAAAMPIDVGRLLMSNKSAAVDASGLEPVVGRRAHLTIPQDFRGPDSGPGAAAGKAVGSTPACWTASRDSSKEQRGTKRMRPAGGSSKAADGEAPEAATGSEPGEEQPCVSAAAEQPAVPAGKLLVAGSRPAWLGEVEQGSNQLNKQRAETWQDDLSKPQEVEFMLGCDKCRWQRVSSLGSYIRSNSHGASKQLDVCWWLYCAGHMFIPLAFCCDQG